METLEAKFDRLDKQLAELLYEVTRLKEQTEAFAKLVYEIIPPPMARNASKGGYGELFGKEKELDLF